MMVRDTGIEPVTSSVSGKRSPAELIARGGDGNRTRVHGFAGRCLTTRPLHRAKGVGVLLPGPAFRADDGIRTRDPHLGKVMRYQLRYIRVLSGGFRFRSGLRLARQNISRRSAKGTNPLVTGDGRVSEVCEVLMVSKGLPVRAGLLGRSLGKPAWIGWSVAALGRPGASIGASVRPALLSTRRF